jgi:uncharacterized protein YlxW (UPF0749 family)
MPFIVTVSEHDSQDVVTSNAYNTFSDAYDAAIAETVSGYTDMNEDTHDNTWHILLKHVAMTRIVGSGLVVAYEDAGRQRSVCIRPSL